MAWEKRGLKTVPGGGECMKGTRKTNQVDWGTIGTKKPKRNL